MSGRYAKVEAGFHACRVYMELGADHAAVRVRAHLTYGQSATPTGLQLLQPYADIGFLFMPMSEYERCIARLVDVGFMIRDGQWIWVLDKVKYNYASERRDNSKPDGMVTSMWKLVCECKSPALVRRFIECYGHEYDLAEVLKGSGKLGPSLDRACGGAMPVPWGTGEPSTPLQPPSNPPPTVVQPTYDGGLPPAKMMQPGARLNHRTLTMQSPSAPARGSNPPSTSLQRGSNPPSTGVSCAHGIAQAGAGVSGRGTPHLITPHDITEGPAHEPAPARESIEGSLSISRSQLEAEIAESGAERGSEPDPKPLVAAGPLHPRTPAKTVDELLEGIEFPGDFENAGEPMPELPFMKSVDKRPLAERLPEMFGGLKLDVPPERLAEAEAYDASRKADAEAKAATMDPEDAAFEEALATFMEMYKLDERVKKVMGRSISEIPQGLEAHHDACRKAAKTIANRYSKAVGAPVVGQASAAIMRAVLMLVEDGRISVPGAVDRLMTMLDWWQAPDGNPKRRSEDGKDWFADATAVFGGKETLQSSTGSPRDAGVIIMAGLNASAAWKHARDRKLDVSKDPFAATGTETYYGIGEALKRGDWGVKQ